MGNEFLVRLVAGAVVLASVVLLCVIATRVGVRPQALILMTFGSFLGFGGIYFYWLCTRPAGPLVALAGRVEDPRESRRFFDFRLAGHPGRLSYVSHWANYRDVVAGCSVGADVEVWIDSEDVGAAVQSVQQVRKGDEWLVTHAAFQRSYHANARLGLVVGVLGVACAVVGAVMAATDWVKRRPAAA